MCPFAPAEEPIDAGISLARDRAEGRMSRSWGLAVVMVCAAMAGVAAAQSDTNLTVTVMGCVQNISSTSPGGGTSRGFLLSNATLANATADSATKGRPPSTATASFLLDGHDGDLKAHVGHKVEVTGTVDAPVETTSEPRGAITGGTGAKSMDQQQRLHVGAVKMLASNCLSK
jgi:hypothetical protein